MTVEHVKVVVVGGGIVGCSVLYGLARHGWTDTLLLERRQLTSGSTWHAAGNVTFFGHYASITRLYVDSVRAYLDAEQESGQPVDFHASGSLRLATNERERAAYERLYSLYEQLGVPYEVVDNHRIEALHPLLNTAGLFGAAHTPGDGHVDPVGATNALARAARQRGAGVRTNTPVTSIKARAGGGYRLQSGTRVVIAEHVVLASSFWTRELAQGLGLDLPLYALEHHELITDSIAELAALDFEVPTVRDPVAPSNTRQERDGFLCGVYESSPVPWAVDGIPPDFIEELLVPDTGRLESHLVKVIERLPAFGQAGIKAINNGPICYTPDGCPLLGPVRSHPGLWLASGFCVGIGTGGGAGDYLARWMIHGHAPYALPIVDPERFAGSLAREEALRRICETYAAGYITPD